MTHLLPVVGFTGPARCGKDTAADLYVQRFGRYKYSFADPMRAMLAMIGVNLQDPYWVAKKEDVIPAFGRSPRYLMQTLGTEWGRQLVHPGMWVTLAKNKLLQHGPGMVVSDVRFENEAAFVRDSGGVLIHIQRPNAQKVNPHSSEAGVAKHDKDLVLLNSGSLQELQSALYGMFNDGT